MASGVPFTGSAGLAALEPGAVELISLWVAPSARGHGVADALIEDIAAWAAGLRSPAIWLSVREDTRILFAENGANQKMELGGPETETGFKSIYDMDAFLHVTPGTAYPAVIFTVGVKRQARRTMDDGQDGRVYASRQHQRPAHPRANRRRRRPRHRLDARPGFRRTGRRRQLFPRCSRRPGVSGAVGVLAPAGRCAQLPSIGDGALR